ncbi:MAG: hypothetical protein V1875_07675 [Candidatus Altiarchaeota archaeon]
MKHMLVIILLSAMAAFASGTSMVVIPPCCGSCICSVEGDCSLCPNCRWATAGCMPSNPGCCGDCSCISPGECQMCGCCLEPSTFRCQPCTTTTSTLSPSSTSSTSSTLRRIITTTTSTLYRQPTVDELLPPTTTTTMSTSSTTVTTTSATTSSTASSTTSTASTVPAPSCDDGRQNQGEDWIDCGGPCDRCGIPDVSAVVENPPFVARGDPFTVTVSLKSNQSGPYSIRLYLPVGLESKPERNVYLWSNRGVSVDYSVLAADYADDGSHDLDVGVWDVRGLEVAGAKSNVTVEEPIVLGPLKLPSPEEIKRRIKNVQEKLVRLVNNTTRILYSTSRLWVVLLLILLFLFYLYLTRIRK